MPDPITPEALDAMVLMFGEWGATAEEQQVAEAITALRDQLAAAIARAERAEAERDALSSDAAADAAMAARAAARMRQRDTMLRLIGEA
jgi:hypothetical protein